VYISKIAIRNFRLLAKIELGLEDRTTVIVGRNNSGKTSMSEVIRRFLDKDKAVFQLEDFSSACYDCFCEAYDKHKNGDADEDIRNIIPYIELRLTLKYDVTKPYNLLSEFVIDVNENIDTAVAVIRYELKGGSISAFFADLPESPLSPDKRGVFFRDIRARLPQFYELRLFAEDPSDTANTKPLSASAIHALIHTGFINAQRGLDGATSKDTEVLGRILEGLFSNAASPNANTTERLIAEALKEAVAEIQEKLDSNFAGELKKLIPTFQTFGYPGLGGPELQTETTLDIKRMVTNFTKVSYAGYSGVSFPEAHNGLGARNLIFILLQLVTFYRSYRSSTPAPAVQIICIEEPEAHLHPQMQEVFIRQLAKLTSELNQGVVDDPWPVQFVVSTHSSHVANAAGFDNIRYFMASQVSTIQNVLQTKVKDLRVGMEKLDADASNFLQQYLTLTRCDLFFADKAVLVEGLSERLMFPSFVKEVEATQPQLPKLSTQYMTVLEVGGAYAHLFFDLLEFLELPSLILTDLDSVGPPNNSACAVHLGTGTSNACIKSWFAGDHSLNTLAQKSADDKVSDGRRLAYQVPEQNGGPCGRTFEDAFMLANAAIFGLAGATSAELETNARELASKQKKSSFALKYAIQEKGWSVPRYIREGLEWLAQKQAYLDPDPQLQMLAEATVAATGAMAVVPEAGGPNANG
jgi:putative ATP-dependent endonuclease of OLD family